MWKLKRMSLEVVTSCEGCGGACCQSMGFMPLGAYVTEHAYDDASKLPAWLLKELRDKLTQIRAEPPVKGESQCMWLDQGTGKCKNYAYRPSICRDFEVGGTGCIARRAEAGLVRKIGFVNGKLVRK
jgi:Fe-S-cluster containining protein